MKPQFVTVLISLFLANAQAQIIIQNPSFEGTPTVDAAPPLWDKCMNTPDIQPDNVVITLAPSDGSSYAGLTDNASHVNQEVIGQTLSSPLQAGVTYSFTIDIARINNGASSTSEIRIYGGMSNCSRDELLWQSDSIFNATSWAKRTVTFTPSANYTYLSIGCYLLKSPPTCYLIIDNMSHIYPRPVMNITGPVSGADQGCSFQVTGTTDSLPSSIMLSGKFTGSPIAAAMLTDSTWQAPVTYSFGFSENDTIIATGTYPSGYSITDTLILNIGCIAPPLPGEIKIPNLFSPNADGHNDTFVIENVPAESELIVFNRWGKQIYRSANYANNWTGESEGDGIYFFHLNMPEQIFKGWLEIRR